MAIYIGCSGWHYDHWQGIFYPESLPKAEWFDYYARQFETVEINNSFYQLPGEETLKDWYQKAPDSFLYTLKGSRYITHMKKLKSAPAALNTFYNHAYLLQKKLGSVLWQLPPNFHLNKDRLNSFCQSLDNNVRNAIEFRHESWFCDEAYQILEDNNVGLVILSTPDLPEVLKTTADFAYIRFHGKTPGNWYQYDYSEAELRRWAAQIQALDTKDIFVYFNNDFEGHAVENARFMKRLLQPESLPSSS